jgi:hypothetical protein
MSTTIHYNAQPGTSDAALYTSSGETTIRRIVAFNATGTDRTVTLSVHRNLSGNVEQLASALAVDAGEAVDVLDNRLLTYNELVLYDGDSIHGLASAATAVNVLAY